jgi:hypothetical protein
LKNPTGQAADTGGDGNGYEVSPTNAFVDDGAFASDNNSGTGTSTSCTAFGKDRHRFSSFGFALPANAAAKGIEVQLQAKVDSASGSPKVCVLLSWNGGASWTSAKTSALTTSETTLVLGSANDLWGRSWSVGDLSNANFRVRIVDVASSTARDFSLDSVAVRVHY